MVEKLFGFLGALYSSGFDFPYKFDSSHIFIHQKINICLAYSIMLKVTQKASFVCIFICHYEIYRSLLRILQSQYSEIYKYIFRIYIVEIIYLSSSSSSYNSLALSSNPSQAKKFLRSLLLGIFISSHCSSNSALISSISS